MATAEGRKQSGLTSLYQVLAPWAQRTLVAQHGADWVRAPSISAFLPRGFSSPADANNFIRSQTLQAIIALWNPVFSKVLQPSDLDLIRQIHAAERGRLDDARVDALLDAMATLVTHAQMPNEAARFQILKKDAGTSVLSKSVEGAAMIGGLLAAGYLIYEGARSLMQSDEQDDNNDDINNNNLNNNNNVNNDNINNDDENPINDVGDVDNANNNNANNDADMAENSGNINHENLQNGENSNNNNENSNSNNNNENSNSNNNNNINNNVDDSFAEEDTESPFVCPITLQIMKDPVITPQGICFERQAIVDWIEKSHTCPISQKPLAVDQLITCYALRAAIEEYQKLRNSKGEVKPPQNKNENVPTSASSANNNSAPSRVHRAVHHAVQPTINVEVAHRYRGQVKCLTSAQLRKEDRFTQYPEASKYITFPASTNYVVSRSTGYVVIENRGNFEVTLISRQREGTLWEPSNEGGRLCGSYSLGPHQEQGFDYRGWYCIEVPPDLNNRPIDLAVTDYSHKGGGKGAWLRMGTGGPEFNH